MTLAVVDRLNAEKTNWSFEVASHVVLDDEVVVLGRLTVDGVVKMAFGTAARSRDASGPTGSVGIDLQVATNDALVRSSRFFGVGLVFQQSERGASTHEPAQETPSPENRVTQKQLGAIHGFARRRNIGRGELGALLHQRFDKNELVSLTKKEASALIDELAQANGHASP